MIHDTLRLALKALLNAQQLEHLVDRQLQREAIEEVRAELRRIDSTPNSDEDIGYSVHLHYEDPRYVTLVVQGRQNYGLQVRRLGKRL